MWWNSKNPDSESIGKPINVNRLKPYRSPDFPTVPAADPPVGDQATATTDEADTTALTVSAIESEQFQNADARQNGAIVTHHVVRREAALTPNSRPAWMRTMERQTAFVRYPGPKPDELSLLEFWTLDHYGICLGVAGGKWARSRGDTALIQRAFGISEEAIIDEQSGVFASKLTAMRFHEVDERGDYFKLMKDNQDLYISRQQGPAGVVVQIINDYLLCRENKTRCSLPAIVKESRTRLFGLPLNFSAAWEELDRHTGSAEQAEVLRSVHAKEAVPKDSLYDRLKLVNAPQQDAIPQDTPRQEGQQQKRGRGSARPITGDTPPGSCVTRGTQPPQGIPGEAQPSRPVTQELSSSLAEQPPRKEPRRECQAPPQPIERQEERATDEDSNEELLVDMQR
ncbi:hypothetical protein R1flu_011782 [Riccia fluitans]|uniref:Uncharacterized protein n=1 Tax=Riccia fluitans TaxID=41844 RepID=A0ABD1Z9P1_9MARC